MATRLSLLSSLAIAVIAGLVFGLAPTAPVLADEPGPRHRRAVAPRYYMPPPVPQVRTVVRTRVVYVPQPVPQPVPVPVQYSCGGCAPAMVYAPPAVSCGGCAPAVPQYYAGGCCPQVGYGHGYYGAGYYGGGYYGGYYRAAPYYWAWRTARYYRYHRHAWHHRRGHW